jgi:hypothetical protein
LLSIEGKFESFIKNVIMIFGFENSGFINKMEFESFLENMCCGVMNIVTPPELILNPQEKKHFLHKMQQCPHISKGVN